MKVRKAVANIQPYAMTGNTRLGQIRLDLNESYWGCSPQVMEALVGSGKWPVSAYPDYSQFLKELSEHYGLPAENFLVTNGADDAIRAVMMAYVEKGETVLTAVPSFGIFDLFAKAMGGDLLHAGYENSLAFPDSAFRTQLTKKPTVAAIVRPDSPTGAVIDPEDLIDLMTSFPETLFILDETYAHFTGESLAAILPKTPNLLILHSFSKAYGLAGIRLGIAISHPDIIRELKKVNPPFATNGMALLAGIAALNDQPYLFKVVKAVKSQKIELITALNRMGFKARNTPANFILMDAGESADDIHQQLVKKNILVKNLSKFPVLKGYFRIAAAQNEQNQAFLTALSEIISQMGSIE